MKTQEIGDFFKGLRQYFEERIGPGKAGETPTKLTFYDLVLTHASSDLIEVYSNNHNLYERERKDPKPNDFFYLKKYEEEIRVDKMISRTIRLNIKPDEQVYRIHKLPSGGLKKFQKHETFEAKKTDIKLLNLKTHSRADLQRDVNKFYKKEKGSKIIKIVRGHYYWSKEDYIVFILALGFDCENSKIVDKSIDEEISKLFIMGATEPGNKVYTGLDAYLFYLVDQLLVENIIQKKSLLIEETAYGKILARGMSHALGSHVIPEYKNLLSKIMSTTGAYIMETDDILRSQLIYAFQYMQDRMELIADVGSRSQTFVKDYSFKELVDEFSSKYIRSIIQASFDDLEHDRGMQIMLYQHFEDVKVAIPGGQIGVSALYLLFESVMRNFYKHSSHLIKNSIYGFGVQISDSEYDRYWQVDFFDILSASGIEKVVTKRSKGLEKGNEFVLLEELRDYIVDYIVDSKGELRKEGWGFLEMVAALKYLNNVPLVRKQVKADNMKTDNSEPSLLIEPFFYHYNRGSGKRGVRFNMKDQVKSDTEKHMNFNLGYRFYLLKPTEILIVKDEFKSVKISRERQKLWNDNGVFFDSYDADSSRHELLVVPPAVWVEYFVEDNDMEDEDPYQQYRENEDDETNKKKKLKRVRKTDKYDLKRTLRVSSLKSFKNVETAQEVWGMYAESLQDSDITVVEIGGTQLIKEPQKRCLYTWNHGGYNYRNSTFPELKSRFLNDNFYLHSSRFNKQIHNVIPKINEPTYTKERAILTECFSTKVTILDERIQEAVLRQSEDMPNLTYRDLWELCGVFIPHKEEDCKSHFNNCTNLDEPNPERIKDIIRQKMTIDGNYVVIHFSLIKAQFEQDANFYNDEDVKRVARKKLIFVSGMGGARFAREDYRSVNLGTLRDVLVNTPDKLSLVNLLKTL